MIKMKKRRFLLLVLGIVLASALITGGTLFAYARIAGLTLAPRTQVEEMQTMQARYGKLYNIQQLIDRQFLWEPDVAAQTEQLCRTLVESLDDPYSAYMSADEYKTWKEDVNGIFTGAGIQFVEDGETGDFVILRVIQNSPAESAGLQPGDVLLQVDGKQYKDAKKMAEAIRGDAGTSVKLTYRRDGKTRSVMMVRGEVEEPSVYATVLDDRYGYLQITGFEKETSAQFGRELAEMENRNVQGLILDLRNNPGGLFDQGVAVADQLLPECTITQTEDRAGRREHYNSDEACTRLPYVVLVNEYTASASEVVAAALQDNGGGLLVGETTFGKGIIQGCVEFNDGSAVRLTILQYLSPNERKIHGKGVQPDYVVKQPASGTTDRQLEKALALLRQGKTPEPAK